MRNSAFAGINEHCLPEGIIRDNAILDFQVDTVPLPRKITSLLPQLASVHIQVMGIDIFEKKYRHWNSVRSGLHERGKYLNFVQNFSLQSEHKT